MDRLDFFASIIGSLAWPGFLLVVLWYNRQRLSNLPDWIDHWLSNLPDRIGTLTLPGGIKFKFRNALDKASAEAKLVASELDKAVAEAAELPSEAPDTARVEGQVASSPVVEQFPETMVVQSFIELEETLGNMVRFLALPAKARDPHSVIEELDRLGYIDQTSVDLFRSLRDAYTAAVREGYDRLTSEEGVRYRQAAQVLNAQLREVQPRLEVDNPRRKSRARLRE
jgi:hypothetical protein